MKNSNIFLSMENIGNYTKNIGFLNVVCSFSEESLQGVKPMFIIFNDSMLLGFS